MPNHAAIRNVAFAALILVLAYPLSPPLPAHAQSMKAQTSHPHASKAQASHPHASPAPAERALVPLSFENSLEHRWLGKRVQASRLLDDMSQPERWRFSGTGTLASRASEGDVLRGERVLRVDLAMYVDSPARTRNRLSAVNLQRPFGGEDWRGYNRISLWIRPDIAGFPMLPLQLVLHNDGVVKIPDRYNREGTHYVTLRHGEWQQVLWEIEPLARDRVMLLEIGYWVNKMLASPGDRVGFEIARLELQRVEPDHVEGWQVAPGRLAFSHSGYSIGLPKTALASGLDAREFRVVRVAENAQPEVVFTGPVQQLNTRFGLFQLLDFSALRTPGRYQLQAGDVRSQPFLVGETAWRSSIVKALNFFFGERCGHPVPDSHGVCHADWTATLGAQRIVMNGGWHDAGDLSQGTLNTAEATYAMFALAEQLQARADDPELLRLALAEAKWGLDWLLRVRFPGGYRIHFASNNLWTNGIIGDADDRSREMKNNPNVNYTAAAAEALAYRVLRERDPLLAERALRIAEDDWRWARAGVEHDSTRDTPAFAATRMELAGVGALASLELYQATGKSEYAAHAKELARTILASQQRRFVGREFPLAGFFYTGPDQDTIFHQFHRGNDQAPIVALARLCELFPQDREWMQWYAAVARYAEYQKASARATLPWQVLPAYVYHEDEYLQQPETPTRYQGTREAFREQVLRGLPMGGGYHLKAFPVWFARRGNYGVLLSQAKALSTAAALRRDSAGVALAELQAQWVVGRNPFAQSTMVGEGYDWAQQYSVSSGDFAGALPVGVQTRGDNDEPYWPAANMYVYKEVWVHPVARWLWLMADLEALKFRAQRSTGEFSFTVASETTADGVVTVHVQARGRGRHTFELRGENLAIDGGQRSIDLGAGGERALSWRGRVQTQDEPWVAVVIPDGDVARRQDAWGALPRYAPRLPAVPAAPRVLGYLGAWSVRAKGLRIDEIPGHRLTHLLYAFGRVSENGLAELGDPCLDIGQCGPEGLPPGVAEGGNLAALRELKQRYPHLRVLISLGGWSGSRYFSDAAATEAARRRLVSSTLDVFLRAHPDVFDGVDVDWEYPVRGGMAENHVRPEDGRNYTLLLEEYRRQLDALSAECGRHYELSIAAAAGPAHVANLELEKLVGVLDFINIMTYDFHAGSSMTHFNSPLHALPGDPTPLFNIESTVQQYLDRGVPRSQLIVGVPFYGRGYGNVTPAGAGLLQPSDAPAAPEWRSVDYRVLAARRPERSGFTRHWSAEAQVPWLYNESTRTWFTYDDPESIAAKARFVREQPLGGIMFWELGGDDGSLLSAIHLGLRTPQH